MDAYSLGRYLRESRETLELTLDDAVNTLRIRRRVLESFEQGEFTLENASQVQVRGFLRNYARYLRLDEDLVIQYYESALAGPRRRGRRGRRSQKQERRNERIQQRREQRATQEVPVAPAKLTDTNPSLPRVSLGEQREALQQRTANLLNSLLIVAVATAATIVIGFVVVQVLSESDSLISDQGDSSILAQMPPSPTVTFAPTFTPLPPATDLPVLQSNYDGFGVAISVQIEQRTWLRVAVDGVEQLARLTTPDEQLQFNGTQTILLEASNAEALNVIYNGQQQGTFGGRGQAVEVTFGVEDLNIMTGPGFDPTPEFTSTALPTGEPLAATLIVARTPTSTAGPSPTPSITPPPSNTPTVTPTPTITPIPSNTAVPTATATVTGVPTQQAANPTATEMVPPTVDPALSATPTAILPLRITPAGTPPTPTKPSS